MKNIVKKSIGLVLTALLMLMAVASSGLADSGTATFNVGVNDYPNHKDYSQNKNLEDAYVNMYTMQLVESKDAFKVIDVETKKTDTEVEKLGNKNNPGKIDSPVAVFQIQKDEMVYFEGFRTLDAAQKGAEKKKSMQWTAPPYKNFGTANNQLCQTHFTKTNEFLQYSKDYACALSLSTPFQDVEVIAEEDKSTDEAQKEAVKKVDLAVMSLTHSDNAFKAKVCNLGDKSVSEFKIKYTANGKENVLTYVPTITPGNCIDIYSWGFGYFGLDTKEKLVSTLAQAKVDPLNDIVESNENNNVASIAPSEVQTPAESTEVEPLNYLVFPRSKDISARGDVVRYAYQNGIWKLENVEKAVLSPVKIVSPTESKDGYSYKAEMGLGYGEKKVKFLAFYPASPIPTELENSDPVITSSFPPQLKAEVENGKVIACSVTEGCAKNYASHAQELLWYEKSEGKFYTIYQKPELESMGDKLFQDNGDSVTPIDVSEPTIENPVSVPAVPTTPLKPELVDNNKPLPAYDENKVKPSASECTDGCSYSDKCLPVGTKVKDGEHFAYCSWEGKMSPQLEEGTSCQNNYECQSNSCSNLKCLDLEKKLEQQQNLLDRILKWMERFVR